MKHFLRVLGAILFAAVATSVQAAGGIIGFAAPAPSGVAIGTGYAFNSATSSLFASTSSSLQFGTPFSIAFGIKTTWPTGNTLLNIINSTSSQTQTSGLWVSNSTTTTDTGNTLQAVTYPGFTGNCSRAACLSLAAINDGNMHAAVMTSDGSTVTLSIDGTFRSQSYIASGGSMTPSTLFWTVGQIGGLETLYNMRIYSRVLSGAEISQDARLTLNNLRASSGSLTTGLVAWWTLDSCTSSCADSSGNSNTLFTETTGPTIAVTVPASGATLSGNGNTMTATCTDTVGCTSVQFYVDGLPTGAAVTSSPWTSTSLNTSLFADSNAHKIWAVGTNAGGLTTTSAQVTFTTNNGITTKNYFLANSGSDSNNCLSSSTPCLTIAHVFGGTFTFHEGDTISLNGGDSFIGCFTMSPTTVASSAPGFPIVIGQYGTGQFTITSNCGSSTVGRTHLANLNGVSGMYLQDCILRGSSGPAFTTSGVEIHNQYNAITDTVVVQRCDIGGFQAGVSGDYGAEVFVHYDSTNNVLNRIQVLNSNLHGLSGTSSLDDNGINGYGAGLGNGLFNVQNVTYQGLLVYNIGGNTSGPQGSTGSGIMCNGVSNCTMQFDVAHDNGGNISTCGGPEAMWLVHTNNSAIQFDEAYNQGAGTSTSGCDQAGFEMDGGVNSSLIQYVYAHHNGGSGFVTCASCAGFSYWGPNTYRYNIAENDNVIGNTFDQGELSMASSTGAYQLFYFYNNLLWGNKGALINWAVVHDAWAAGSLIANNILVANGASFYAENHGNSASLLWPNNDWYTASGSPGWTCGNGFYTSLSAWATACGTSTGTSITTNPNVTSGGSGGTCYSSGVPQGPQNSPVGCPTAYQLANPTTSPVRGAGVDLTQSPYSLSVGTHDYFGASIPNGVGSGYNIGPDQRTSLSCSQRLDFSAACNSMYSALTPG